MRQIVLDTETTGLEPTHGHRLVEIGCLEVFNYMPTGKIFHTYINPERDVPERAFEVHGLSQAFLKGHPLFKDVAKDFLAFIGDSQLVIHNAKFDMKFLNHELKKHGHKEIHGNRSVDTLIMARNKYPGSPASLDALCKKFGINNSGRQLHGALLDAQLLAEVYLELMGGRQPDLNISDEKSDEANKFVEVTASDTVLPARVFAPSADELAAHASHLEQLSNPIWKEIKR